mmetsp:Transcript_31345/g.5647  ORF Transcript_31345/g.5647 Transcript_31345/m.5647 type:complete len:84 (-) Transcript_31345:212-463(-)
MCLANHNITEELRAKMIDWMVEVLKACDCSDSTFFLSVKLMELYFSKETIPIQINDIHLIGVVCMFIASKYHDIQPLRMKTVQ